jgi:predicted GIY-YIG superfamily endonuclease
MPWVYIIKCRDSSYYTGSAADLEKRLAEHQEGTYDGYTACRRPVRLVFSQQVGTMHEAFLLERQIKGWSRAKKEAIISGNYDLLPELSRCRSRNRKASANPPASFDPAQDAASVVDRQVGPIGSPNPTHQ